MKKYLIHHLADLQNAEIIFGEQVSRLIKSGILRDTEYHVCINGKSDRFQPYLKLLNQLYQISIINIAEDCSQYEYPTLKYLELKVSMLNEPAAIGYIHLKGLINQGMIQVINWRHLMEFFIIDNYKHCIKWLTRDIDIVGCNWTVDTWMKPHFSGNFWWAKSEYIKTLPKLPVPKDCIVGSTSPFTGHIYDNIKCFRYDHENWITSGNYKVKNMYSSGINHYYDCWPEERYINTVFEP
jgi:hypothetical protein